ncbi:hypothetical protein H6P81_006375 [Aristolochia fimbriata]|uniref:CCHC-type domain-containing protein n=1 Tax=Aristolochia fimbriata TaxID=158543 RepID=A0AAV7EYB9_ARIFI|nr:hypothetical protein H6P81_006375 [Aristolochia fimbriata]
MGVMETSLTSGPVYFNIYPDLALSMTDPHLLKSLSLNLMIHNYHFLPGSETIVIVYRIYYRVLNTLTSHVKVVSEKGKTTLVESNMISTKTAVPQTLRWDEIEFPATWQMSEVTVPQTLDNRDVEQIIHDADGNVEITFAPNLRRKIPLITAGEDLPDQSPTARHPRNPKWKDEFDKLVYKWFRDWYFATFEGPDLLYIKDWYYTDLVQWQLNTGAVIKSVFPPKDALTIQGVKGASVAVVHPVETTTSTPTTQDIEGKLTQLVAQKASKPTLSEASTSTQVIKSPLIHPPMKLELLPKDRTADLLEKFLEKIGSRQINTLPEERTFQQTLPLLNQAVHVKQEYSRVSPSRPQPFDLNTEENPLVYSNSYDAKVIYEWNIDNPTPKKVQDTIHRMLIYSNVCRSRGMTEPIVVNQIVAELSGDLYGWWYNYLDEPYHHNILYAVKTDASGAPLLDSEDKPISDAVMSLLVSIVSNFSWDPSRQTETTKYLLHNNRCRTLTDLNWYITTFRSRVMTLPDAANLYWKQRFIEGLPTQFATKVKEGLRQNPNEEVNWTSLHYGHLQAACTQQGLALCNDLRLKKQLKRDHISATTLGEFCKQFAFDPVPANPCGNCAAKRPTKPLKPRGKRGCHLPFSKSLRPKEKSAEPSKRAFTSKPRASTSKPSCYKCGRQGHLARECFARQKQKVNELAIDDQSKALVIQMLEEEDHYTSSESEQDNIELIKSSDSSALMSSDHEDSDQLDQLKAMFRMTISLNMLTTDDLFELFSRNRRQPPLLLIYRKKLRTANGKYRIRRQHTTSCPPESKPWKNQSLQCFNPPTKEKVLTKNFSQR